MNIPTRVQPKLAHISEQTSAFLSGAADLGFFVGGKWSQAVSGETLDVYDPATGALIAKVASGAAADIDLAVAKGRDAFEHGPWPRMAAAKRSAILMEIARALEEDVTLLSELEVLDNGVQLAMAQGGVRGAAALFRYYAGWVGKIAGEAWQADGFDPSQEITAFTRREPIGVVAQILPWNFPLVILALKLAPALAAGCVVVIKPAEETPLAALAFAKIAQKAGLPDGVLSVITGLGETAGAALSGHPDVDKISFTGSTEVGKLILTAAGSNMKKVTLELGGKAPFIVFPDADLSKVVPAIVRGAFGNQGQNCIAAPRIYVHSTIAKQIETELVAAVKALEIGAGFDNKTIGPLISTRHLDRVSAYIERGVADGATLATGGECLDGPGYFMTPAVFTNVDHGMAIMREEIFGPVVCLQTFDTTDLDELAALANDTDYGLIASIWTQNLTIAHRLAARIRAGTVCFNGHNHPGPNAPFGGYKQSGWGREFGRAAMESYLETKTVAIYA